MLSVWLPVVTEVIVCLDPDLFFAPKKKWALRSAYFYRISEGRQNISIVHQVTPENKEHLNVLWF